MRVGSRAALLWVLILGAGTAGAQDAPKYLSVENGTTYALSARDKALSARVPVRPEPKIALADLEVTVADVIVEGRHDPGLIACITPAEEFDGPGTPAIVLRVTCDHRRPDDYDVTVAVARARASAGSASAARQEEVQSPNPGEAAAALPAVQKIGLKLTRPVPALRAIAGQSVEQIVLWPGTTIRLAPSSLIISETSNRTLPVTFTATQVDTPTIDGRPVPGKLQFASATTDAQGHAELRLSVPERFPLGKAKTTVEIRSEDIAAPIYVAFDIATKLHVVYALAAIVAGLLLGFLTRTILKTWVDRGTAKIAALDLLEKMRTARDRWHAAGFRNAVDKLITTLEGDLAGADAAALKSAVTTTDAAFAVASAELQTRVAAVLASIETSAALTGSPSQFPQSVAAALTDASGAFASARLKVVGGDVDAGERAAQAALATLGPAVENAAADWRTSVQSALATLGGLAPLPPSLQPVLRTAVAGIAEQIAKLPAPSRAPNVATILEALHAIRFLGVHDLTQRVLTPMTILAADAIKVLRGAGASAPTVEAANRALARAIEADTDTTLAEPARVAGDLLKALQKDIAAAAAAAGVNVAVDLAAGGYVEAAAKVAGAGRLAAGSPVTSQPAAGAATTTLPPLTLPARLLPAVPVATREPVEVERARTFREIAAAKAGQFAIAAAGILAVGALALVPTFDGTWRGVLTAFLWGYAGDISVDALTDAAKKVK
jgi:hypothetical protein